MLVKTAVAALDTMQGSMMPDLTSSHTLEDLIAALSGRSGELSPQLQKAAVFAVEEPATVAAQSMRRTASAAGVRPSTMLRLARAIGFATYDEFRERFQNGIAQALPGYPGRAQALQVRGKIAENSALWPATIDAGHASLDWLRNSVSPKALQQASGALCRARRVVVIANLSARSAAHYFQYVLAMVRPDVSLAGLQDAAVILNRLNGRDVVVAVSFHPYATRTVEWVKYAQSNGAVTIAVTDNRTSPIARSATHLFQIPYRGLNFFGTLAPTFVLMEALIAGVVTKGGPAVVKRLNTLDRAHEDLEDYI
jgi:DNA-binding MurR/RpiR family transcriptional regulator